MLLDERMRDRAAPAQMAEAERIVAIDEDSRSFSVSQACQTFPPFGAPRLPKNMAQTSSDGK